MTELESMAFNASVDYKPWDTELNYTSYYEKGFEVGFIRALQILDQNGIKGLQKYKIGHEKDIDIFDI